MSNTTTHGKGAFTITGLDADWTYGTDVAASTGFPANGMWISRIQFIPSAVADRMIIHDGGIDAQEIFDSGAVTSTDPVIEYYDDISSRKPVIDIDDCTLSSAAAAKVIISYK